MNRRTVTGISAPIQAESGQYNRSLLIEDYPLLVLPTLAQSIGLEEAIVVQQIHFLLRNPGNGRVVNGRRWIYNTYEQWLEVFPFWSSATLRRIFGRLEEMHLVVSCQPEGGVSRRKYYRLNEGMVLKLRKGTVDIPSAQIEHIDCSECALPNTETTNRDYLSKESKETSRKRADTRFDSQKEIPAQWIPDQRTKEQKLAALQVPRNYPSEREFEDFMDSEGFTEIPNKRPDLYGNLCDQKWHHWTGRKWKPIANWKMYVRALEEKIAGTN